MPYTMYTGLILVAWTYFIVLPALISAFIIHVYLLEELIESRSLQSGSCDAKSWLLHWCVSGVDELQTYSH